MLNTPSKNVRIFSGYWGRNILFVPLKLCLTEDLPSDGFRSDILRFIFRFQFGFWGDFPPDTIPETQLFTSMGGEWK